MSNVTKMDRARTVVGIAAVFVAAVGGVLLLQREVVNKVTEIRDTADSVVPGVKVEEPQSSSGGNTEMAYYENKSSDKLLIFFHGAAGPDIDKPKTASNFVNVLAPTYATNTIAPLPLNDQRLYDVVDLSMREALSRGFEYEDISVIGFSMGGAQAVYGAVHYPDLNIVISIGTFTSFRSACENLASISTCTLVPDSYLFTEGIAGDSEAPIHQYHSRDDKVVSIADGRKLFSYLGSGTKEFTELRGEHSDYDIVQILSDNL